MTNRYTHNAGDGQRAERRSKRASHAIGRLSVALVALLVGLWTVMLYGQSVMPTPRQQFLDNNGNPCASCLLYSFAAGTNTPQNTYADVTLATPNTNPVILDSAGRATVFLDTRLTYKFTLATAADVPIWTVDAVDAVPSALNVDVTGIAGEPLAQRQAVYLSSGLDATVAGRWYLADADVVSKSSGASLVGIVMAPAIATLASGQIRIQGRVTGFVGLSEGLSYFVSATAGALTSTAPANVKVVGVAETTSTLLLTPSAASSGGVGAFSTLQVTSTAANSIDTAGGIEAGTGNVQIVGVDGRIPILDSTTVANQAAVLSTVQFTGFGAAAAGKIGLSANQLALLGGSSGHGFFTSGGGLHTNVDAAGVWTFSVGNARGIIVSRTSGDAGIQLTSVGGSGTAYGITSTTAGNLSIQHDADANPSIVLNGVANTVTIAATGGIALNDPVTPTRINSGSAQPGFLAYRSTNQGGGPGGVIILFDTEVFDTTNNYNPATGQFTAPVAGQYHFCAGVAASSLGSGGAGIVHAGGLIWRIDASTSNARHTGCVTLSLAANALVHVFVDKTDASGIVGGTANGVLTYFTGRLIP